MRCPPAWIRGIARTRRTRPSAPPTGWINIGGGSPTFWPLICRVGGADALVDDPRFATPALRVQHRKALEALLEARFRTAPTAAWLERLEQAGVPAGPILAYAEVFADAHVRQREMAVEVDHPQAGRTRVLGIPYKLTPGGIRRPAPRLGQHTAEVLRQVGYDEAAIRELHARRIVVSP